MAEILRGAPVAKALCEALSPRVRTLRDGGTVPTLAIVRAGARPDGVAYESSILNRCARVGIEVQRCVLSEDCVGVRLPEEIRRINEDPLVHGCLMIRPLGNTALEQESCALLAPEKDVDGMTPLSLAAVFSGNGPGYPPCTARACLEILDFYRIPLRGSRAVVIGRSLVVGRPLAMLLQARDATVTICHSGTGGLADICQGADILVAAAGQAGMVDCSFLSPGQVIIDVGASPDENGKLLGDVRFDEAEPVAAAITPVPGGVGAVTTAVLCGHVVEAAEGADGVSSKIPGQQYL